MTFFSILTNYWHFSVRDFYIQYVTHCLMQEFWHFDEIILGHIWVENRLRDHLFIIKLLFYPEITEDISFNCRYQRFQLKTWWNISPNHWRQKRQAKMALVSLVPGMRHTRFPYNLNIFLEPLLRKLFK